MKRAVELFVMLMLAAALLVGGLANSASPAAEEAMVAVVCAENNP